MFKSFKGNEAQKVSRQVKREDNYDTRLSKGTTRYE